MLNGETFRSQQGYLLTATGSVTFLPVLALGNINPRYLKQWIRGIGGPPLEANPANKDFISNIIFLL